MISVAYRTSLEMFCDVKLHFSQLLTAHVLTVAILGILIYLWSLVFGALIPLQLDEAKLGLGA